ncbi:MAG TPA: hypothetical protein VGR71_16655 [Nitrospira sp.]|nr:hypothetical protein [Nitrospira sp.]
MKIILPQEPDGHIILEETTPIYPQQFGRTLVSQDQWRVLIASAKSGALDQSVPGVTDAMIDRFIVATENLPVGIHYRDAIRQALEAALNLPQTKAVRPDE